MHPEIPTLNPGSEFYGSSVLLLPSLEIENPLTKEITEAMSKSFESLWNSKAIKPFAGSNEAILTMSRGNRPPWLWLNGNTSQNLSDLLKDGELFRKPPNPIQYTIVTQVLPAQIASSGGFKRVVDYKCEHWNLKRVWPSKNISNGASNHL